QRHELSLKIGGKPGVRLGGDVDGLQRAGAHHNQATIGWPDLRSRAFEHRTHRAEMFEMRSEDLEMASCNRRGDCIGSRFNTVGDELVARLAKGIHTLDQYSVRASAFNPRPHCPEAEAKV